MKTMSVIPEEELVEARRAALEDIKLVVGQYARRAKRPATRSAMAEMEQEVAEMERRWAERGLIPAA